MVETLKRLIGKILCCALVFCICINSSMGALQGAGKDKHTSDDTIEIKAEGQRLAGIKTTILRYKQLPTYVTAPGEVIPNVDESAIVTPRIESQIVKRLVQVGVHVAKGQPLVKLTSVVMADAQAKLLLASKEWKRMKMLGQEAVSAKRYQLAQINYQQAYARLMAYGMKKQQIDAFLKSDNASKANGEFTLLAFQAGTVISADFLEGQMVKPGFVLYRIVDEKKPWVDARLSDVDAFTVKKNAKVIIKTQRDEILGRVLQVHHQLEETTRTQIIRIEVSNNDHILHPGQFVTCLIHTGDTKPVLAVPKDAVVRTSDGDNAVYIEVKRDHFKAVEIKLVKTIRNWAVIEGIEEGSQVVTQGAFFVHSEKLKGGFDIHNH